MRKTLVAVGLLFGLVGCGQSAVEVPRSSGPVTPVQSADQLFKNALTDEYYSDLPKDALVPAGRMVCTRLSSGATIEEISLSFIKNSIPPEAAGQLLGAAITVYCPQYNSKLDAAVAQYGG